MPFCSPRYIQNKQFKNTERMYVSGVGVHCGEYCIHYKACIIELNGGNETIAPLMSQESVDLLSVIDHSKN